MGWDAYTSVKTSWIKDCNDVSELMIEDKEVRLDFQRASKEAIYKGGFVDGSLQYGGLGLRDSGRMLGKAWYNSYIPPSNLNKQKAKSILSQCNWDFDYTKENAGYYWSARLFIETCAKLDLEVWFSY